MLVKFERSFDMFWILLAKVLDELYEFYFIIGVNDLFLFLPRRIENVLRRTTRSRTDSLRNGRSTYELFNMCVKWWQVHSEFRRAHFDARRS